MKFVNVRELKNRTSAVLTMVDKGEDVIVTSRGKPRAVIRHLSEEEIEDYILMNHPDFAKKLKKSRREYRVGKTAGIDALIEEMAARLGKR